MHEQIDAALDARLKDQTVVEVEIQEHVVERIQKLGKLIGIPLVLFFAVLGVWGIRSLSDVDGKIKQATDDAIKGMNNKVEVATQSSLQALKEKVDRETNDIVESAKKNAKASLTQAAQQATTDLQSQAQGARRDIDSLRVEVRNQLAALKPEINAVNQRLGSVESTINYLTKACGAEDSTAISSIADCHEKYPNGCTPSANYDAYMNSLRNRTPSPDSIPAGFLTLSDFVALDRRVPTITRNKHELIKSKLEELGEGRIQGVIGYLYQAKLEGAESTNCELVGPENVDYMIHVGFDDKIAAALRDRSSLSPSDRKKITQTSIVAEITPFYRLKFHPGWSIGQFSALLGRQIKVIGQLMLDSEHFVVSQDCALGLSPQCWRASAWEIHPVTELYVCVSDKPCPVQDSHWVKLEQAQ